MWDTEEIYRIINQYQELPADEQTRLARIAQSGDIAARDRLILSNLRLVVAKVKPWFSYGEAADVIQEGIIGMNRAIDKYDPKSGYAFSTYAVYWIQQAARRWASKQHVLYIPINVHDAVVKVQMCVKAGVTDPQEIARQTEMSMKHVKFALSLTCLKYASLDRKVSEAKEKSVPLGNIIPDEHDQIEDLEDEIELEYLMSILNERERQIVQLRFGIGEEDEMPLTFPAIGKRFGVTTQRVTQIYENAMKKMRKAAGVTPMEVAS